MPNLEWLFFCNYWKCFEFFSCIEKLILYKWSYEKVVKYAFVLSAKIKFSILRLTYVIKFTSSAMLYKGHILKQSGWRFVHGSSSNKLALVCSLQTMHLLVQCKFCENLWTSKWRQMLVIMIQSFTCVMLIQVLDIECDNIWECKQIYFELRTNIKTDRFLLSVSI